MPIKLLIGIGRHVSCAQASLVGIPCHALTMPKWFVLSDFE
jgi:hypothetical protein